MKLGLSRLFRMLTEPTKIDLGDWKLAFVRQVAFIALPLRMVGHDIIVTMVFCFFLNKKFISEN